MPNRLLCPSMMCANFANLNEEVFALEQAGIDIFHMDIMDGQFVPNFGMGLQDFELIASLATKPVDVHLMIQDPVNYVETFADLGAGIIYIHSEADQQPTRTLDLIHAKGKQAGIAINPGTSVETISELLPLVDYLMVMTVNPGFAGQKYLDFVTNKIKKLVELKKTNKFQLMVDGAISPEKVTELSGLGVDGFILGSSALFGKTETYSELISQLRM